MHAYHLHTVWREHTQAACPRRALPSSRRLLGSKALVKGHRNQQTLCAVYHSSMYRVVISDSQDHYGRKEDSLIRLTYYDEFYVKKETKLKKV